MRLVTQVYGHSLREVLGLNDDLPLARGVSGIPGTDEPKLGVANLLLLERVGLPTPRARLGTIRRSAKKTFNYTMLSLRSLNFNIFNSL